jgi:putative endonuclease
MYFIYSLRCKDGFYVGCTNNLKDRLFRHKNGWINATKNRLPIKLDFYIAVKNKYTAFELEKYFKTGSGRVFIKRHLI